MNETRPWVARAVEALERSLAHPPIEPNELDWKSGLSPNKERLVEHLSAFANEAGGGFLVFGVDEGTRQVRGVGEGEVEGIVHQLANLGREGLEPPVLIEHAVIASGSASLLVVRVAESEAKPVHRRGKSIERAWIRSGGSTRLASRQDLGRLMLNSRAPRWEELRASPLLPPEEVVARLDVAAICAKLERPTPAGVDESLRWLVAEHMAILDGEGAVVTNLGAIAAARDLETFETLARKRLRIVRYRGLNKVETIDETAGRLGYAVGFEGLVAYLKRVLPHSEVIREALRRDTTVYPEIALRELAANTLVHQDFTLSGTGPMIDIFDDRIEFTSPGALLPSKTVDRLIGTPPESRNESLASAFRRYRICEERGSGFQKVVTAVELYGLPPLKFEVSESAFKVVLSAPRAFSEMTPAERIEACYQHAVIKYISSGAMTNTSLRARLQVSEQKRTQVSNVISDAVNAGRIRRRDTSTGNKFAEYWPYWA